jgi:hypothetical protein
MHWAPRRRHLYGLSYDYRAQDQKVAAFRCRLSCAYIDLAVGCQLCPTPVKKGSRGWPSAEDAEGASRSNDVGRGNNHRTWRERGQSGLRRGVEVAVYGELPWDVGGAE